jgi:hypothetical protein
MSSTTSELYSMLLADPTSGNPPGSTPGVVPSPTLVNGIPVAAALELQSTSRALLLPRMNTAARDAMTPVANGMMIYNSQTNAINTYENGAWGAGGNGNVVGPNASTNNALAVFNGVTGTILAGGTAILNPVTNIISGVANLLTGNGTAALPSFSFTGNTDTGIYQLDANTIGFAANGVNIGQIGGVANSVNSVQIFAATAGANPSIAPVGADNDITLFLSGKNNGNVLARGGLVLNSTQGAAPATNVNQVFLNNALLPAGLGTTLAITGSAVNGPVTTVNPTAPNRTVAIVVNGTTYYLAAKTTND